MSDRRRVKITKELMEKEYVTPDDKKRALATVLYETRNAYPFMGAVLQSMNIMYTHAIPTAGISFNTDAKRWDMWINPKYFCHSLDNAVIIEDGVFIAHRITIKEIFVVSPLSK